MIDYDLWTYLILVILLLELIIWNSNAKTGHTKLCENLYYALFVANYSKHKDHNCG